jgi:hypothetical protein
LFVCFHDDPPAPLSSSSLSRRPPPPPQKPSPYTQRDQLDATADWDYAAFLSRDLEQYLRDSAEFMAEAYGGGGSGGGGGGQA